MCLNTSVLRVHPGFDRIHVTDTRKFDLDQLTTAVSEITFRPGFQERDAGVFTIVQVKARTPLRRVCIFSLPFRMMHMILLLRSTVKDLF
jgi:hypothetical protein